MKNAEKNAVSERHHELIKKILISSDGLEASFRDVSINKHAVSGTQQPTFQLFTNRSCCTWLLILVITERSHSPRAIAISRPVIMLRLIRIVAATPAIRFECKRRETHADQVTGILSKT